jgi:hypothetical protein
MKRSINEGILSISTYSLACIAEGVLVYKIVLLMHFFYQCTNYQDLISYPQKIILRSFIVMRDSLNSSGSFVHLNLRKLSDLF